MLPGWLSRLRPDVATLADQIRARWGHFGDWQSADQDQAEALARLLQANGVSDLSQFQLKARDYTIDPTTWETEAGTLSDGGRSGTAFDAFNGDQALGFLGDINRDGSYTAQSTEHVPGNEALGQLRGNGDLLGWNAQGGGNTSFRVVQGPDGQPVVVPVWGSSSQSTFEDLRGIASIAALAAGGTFAGAGGVAGSAAQGALQGYGTAVGGNMLLGGGDVDSLVKSSLAGAGTGALAGGIKAYGADQGWNPNVTRAATNAATTAARGGDVRDIAGGAVSGGLLNVTGNPALDRAIAAGGSTLLRGGNTSDALRSGVISGATGLLNTGMSRNLDDVTGDALSQDNVVRFDGGGTVGNEFDWNAWLQEQMDGSNRGTDPWQFDWADLGVDTGTNYSNEGRNYPTAESTQGPGGSPVNAGMTDWARILQALGGGKGVAALLGGAAGALDGGDKQQSASRDPWGPAQPYLKGLLSEGADLYGQMKAQPLSQSQGAGYANVGGLLDLINQNAGGLLSGPQANASGANSFVRGQPQRSLIGSAFNPTAEQWRPQSFGDMGVAGLRMGTSWPRQ